MSEAYTRSIQDIRSDDWGGEADTWSREAVYHRCLPLNIFFFDEFTAILEFEQKHLKADYTTEQVQAGIKNLEKYGVMGTLFSLTDDDLTKIDEYLLMPYSLVLLKLLHDKDRSDFQKRYEKIIRAEK